MGPCAALWQTGELVDGTDSNALWYHAHFVPSPGKKKKKKNQYARWALRRTHSHLSRKAWIEIETCRRVRLIGQSGPLHVRRPRFWAPKAHQSGDSEHLIDAMMRAIFLPMRGRISRDSSAPVHLDRERAKGAPARLQRGSARMRARTSCCRGRDVGSGGGAA